jgi:hypothetical protein
MGLGFSNNNSDIASTAVLYADRKGTSPPQNQGADIWKILRGVGGIIATLALLGGLVWGTAFMFAGMASDEDLDKVEDRVELVEKNDIRQTVVLEQIKEALETISGKLDEALKK